MNGSKYLTRSTSLWTVNNNTIMSIRFVLGASQCQTLLLRIINDFVLLFFLLFQQIR